MSLTPPDKDALGDWNTNVYADQWVPNTRIDFCRVRWDSEYRDIVQFDDQSALDAYIDQQTINYMRIERMTTVRPMEPIRVNIPYNVAVTANYVRVNNPALPTRYVDSTDTVLQNIHRNYYYFLLDARYIAPNTTELIVQLDVWQTFGYEITPGWSYAERGHVGIANEHNFWNNGQKYLTIPEGLDQGNEYSVIHTAQETISRNDFGVIVWATSDLETSGGSVDNPKLVTAVGSSFGGVPNGASSYYFSTVGNWMDWLYEHYEVPWVTQSIISVMAVPPLSRYGVDAPEGIKDRLSSPHTPEPINVNMSNNWRETVANRLPEKYRHLRKFLTYPYCVVEITTYTGAPIVLKPEQWNSPHAPVIEIPHLTLPGPRVVISPQFYNTVYGASNDATTNLHDGGEFLDIATGIFDFPQFSVVNNSYMGFLASNRHNIQYQHDSADWSHSKAQRAADTGYDQATMGMDAADQQTANTMNTNNATVANQNQHGTGRAITQAGTSLGMGMMGGPMGLIGGVTSAVSTGANEALNQSERNAQNTITNSSLRRSNEIQSQYSAGIRDSNRSLAQYSARGDYANQVAGINARVQDAKMTQPTTSGQSGGEAFNLVTQGWIYDFKVKIVPDGAMDVIGDFWLRYGYAINTRIYPETLQVMSHFTYWKFQEFTITNAHIAEHYKNAIRGIFEKGVTVWSRPEDIHMVNSENNTPILASYYT